MSILAIPMNIKRKVLVEAIAQLDTSKPLPILLMLQDDFGKTYEHPLKQFLPISTMARNQLFYGIAMKDENTLTTEYLKSACILPINAVIADPTGTIVTYEGGSALRALIYKNGSGERDLAKACLDEYVTMQHADGSWDQQYYPRRNADGSYTLMVATGEPYSDIQVDSGASMLAWAMAEYDASVGAASTLYKAAVQKAWYFLELCQYYHNVAHASNLLANQRWDYIKGTPLWNTTALMCDCAEAILSAKAVLDQYGSDLKNSNGVYVKTITNNLYASLATLCWMGDADPASVDDSYFRTEYPADGSVWLMPADIVPQAISYTQAMVAWAIYEWANSGYLDGGTDYSYLCERALNYAIAFTMGKWGGFYYHPIGSAFGKGIKGDDIGLYDEFPPFTALMVLAMNAVNATKYARQIDRSIRFIRLSALEDGSVFNRVKIDGSLDLGEAGILGAGYHFRAMNSAYGLLAGA